MTEKTKTEPTREEKTAALWAALKTLPEEYVIHVSVPGAPPITRRFVGDDLRRCIEITEAAVEEYRHAYDIEMLARLRAKEASGEPVL